MMEEIATYNVQEMAVIFIILAMAFAIKNAIQNLAILTWGIASSAFRVAVM
jgi:hypothetical protein